MDCLRITGFLLDHKVLVYQYDFFYGDGLILILKSDNL